MSASYGNTTVSVTHLLWCDRWIEVCRAWDERLQEACWRFKDGRDAADWLLWPPVQPSTEDGGEQPKETDSSDS